MSIITNRFKHSGKVLNNNDFIQIESKYNFKFPKEVKELYMEFNGGEPEKYIYIDEDGDDYVVQKILSIKYSEKFTNTLEGYIESFRRDNIIPNWLIPFGYDPGGNIYCFSLQNDEFGTIYFWDHEYDENEDIDDHLIYLCDSILEFVNSLVIYKND